MSHGVGLAAPRPNEFLPDARRAALPDILARNLYFFGTEETSHTTLTVGNEQSTMATETMRIRSVTVGELTTDTVTVQVYVDGEPIFDDSERPVSGGGVAEPTNIFNFPPGSVITTTIEASTGVPAGTANVVIDTEPFVLVPKTEEVKLKGKDRLFPSRRRRAALVNEFRTGRGEAAENRLLAGIGSAPQGAGDAPINLGDFRDFEVPPPGTPRRLTTAPRRR